MAMTQKGTRLGHETKYLTSKTMAVPFVINLCTFRNQTEQQREMLFCEGPEPRRLISRIIL